MEGSMHMGCPGSQIADSSFWNQQLVLVSEPLRIVPAVRRIHLDSGLK